jgi:hypothetical protein
MNQPARPNDSPWRPLLVWLGPIFVLTNLSIIPLVVMIVGIAMSGMFAKGNEPPDPRKAWLPLLEVLWQTGLVLVPVQAVLATLCLTWGPGPFWRRLLSHWLVVVMAIVCVVSGIPVLWPWSIGSALASGREWNAYLSVNDPWGLNNEHFWRDLQQSLAIPCMLPMLLLGLQTPFWALRLFAGCRLEKRPHDSADNLSSADALSIKDLLLATAIIAASLALLQFSDRVFAGEGNAAQAFLFNTLIGAAVCIAFSLLTAVPLTLLIFSRLSLPFIWGLALALAGACSVAIFAVLYNMSPMPSPAQQFGQMCLTAYVYVIGYAGGLTVLRRSGWRLAGRARSVRDV